MAEQLVIYLKDIESQQCDWLFCDFNGQALSPVEQGSLSDMVEKNRNAVDSSRRVVVLLSSRYIHFSQVAIPSRNKQRVLQAVPFALEDQLADDVDELYFAIGKQVDGQYPVAVMQQTLLDQLLQIFVEFNIKIDMLGIDLLALPLTNTDWTVLIDNKLASIRFSPYEIINTNDDNLVTMLQVLLKQQDKQLPEKLNLLVHQDSTLEIDLGIETEIRHFAKSPLTDFVKHLKPAVEFNLLQGQYSPQQKTAGWWRPWRAAAVISAVLITAQLIMGHIELSRLEDENRLLSAEIDRVFKQSFPGTKRVVNARVQMENQLKALRKGTGKAESGFVELLADTASALSKDNKLNIDAINYRNRRMELDITAEKLGDLEALKNDLVKNRQLKVEILSATSEDKIVKGRLRVEATGT